MKSRTSRDPLHPTTWKVFIGSAYTIFSIMNSASICFVLPSAYGYFNPEINAVGGGARQLSLISRCLTDEFDVHFVVGDYGQPLRETRDGVTLHRAYHPSPNTPTWQKPVELGKLFRAMRRADADIYLYRGRPYLATITYVLSQSLGAKWVYNIANDPNLDEHPKSFSLPLSQIFERALHDADLIITQTKSQSKMLQEHYGEDSVTIPSGYPPADDIKPYGNRDTFIWVGRIDSEQKRPHIMLDVAERVPVALFEMIGPLGQDERYNTRIRSRARELENVTYHGSVDPDQIHDFYRDAIALIHTAQYEGFPSVFLEAWRYDTPVLSLSIPQSRYANVDHSHGFANDDVERLAEFVYNLQLNPENRPKLSRPTYEYFKHNLTIKKVADQYSEVIRKIE